jgi:hypothetical protein
MRLGDALPLPDLESELGALGKPISHSDASLRTITLVALGKPISHSDSSL